jgi:hypothetical protein
MWRIRWCQSGAQSVQRRRCPRRVAASSCLDTPLQLCLSGCLTRLVQSTVAPTPSKKLTTSTCPLSAAQ